MTKTKELQCGIIMPIAAMPGYTADHWQDVKNIIIDAMSGISEFNFKTKIVSDSDGEVDVIHKRIVQNIYNSDMVICDISGKNPNVLFELGMRLTFDKPTIIIKDDPTDFIFDTGVIEHLTYPKDLRFQSIVDFKNKLAEKVVATYNKSKEDPGFSTFLKNFGKFEVTKLEQVEVTDVDQAVLSEIRSLRNEVKYIRNEQSAHIINRKKSSRTVTDFDHLESVIETYLALTQNTNKAKDIISGRSFIDFLKVEAPELLPLKISDARLINIIERKQAELDLLLPF